jgi:hypothetical protein
MGMPAPPIPQVECRLRDPEARCRLRLSTLTNGTSSRLQQGLVVLGAGVLIPIVRFCEGPPDEVADELRDEGSKFDADRRLVAAGRKRRALDRERRELGTISGKNWPEAGTDPAGNRTRAEKRKGGSAENRTQTEGAGFLKVRLFRVWPIVR